MLQVSISRVVCVSSEISWEKETQLSRFHDRPGISRT